MKIIRINENTISCIITPEDLREKGFRIDDFFERKKEAVDFIRSVVAQVAIAENFNLEGELTTMRISVLPDHSLSLLITREDTKDGAMTEIRRLARSLFESFTAGAASGKDKDPDAKKKAVSDSLMKALLSEDSAKGREEEETKAPVRPADSYMFSFYSVRDAMDCCRVFEKVGRLESSFYYLREDEIYFLIVRRTQDTAKGFEKVVLLANEFGELVTSNEQHISFVTEHGVCIAKEHALEMFIDVLPGIRIPKIRRGRSAQQSAGADPEDPEASAGLPAEQSAEDVEISSGHPAEAQ